MMWVEKKGRSAIAHHAAGMTDPRYLEGKDRIGRLRRRTDQCFIFNGPRERVTELTMGSGGQIYRVFI